jgi:TusA-related sulfurtransferase
MAPDRASVEIVPLDIRGTVCPASLLLTLRKLNELKDPIHGCAARLEVSTDSRDSVATITEAAVNMGYLVSVDKGEGRYVLTISGTE